MSVAWAPMLAPSATRVSSHFAVAVPGAWARGNAARGRRTLVNIAPGPTKTSAPSVTPSHTLVWPCSRVPAPITAPAATNENAPTTAPAPSAAPRATTAVG